MEPEGSLPHSQFPPPVPILSQMNPVHDPLPHYLKIQLNIILPSMPGSFKWFFPSGIPTENFYSHLLSTTRATCPAHLIFPDLITEKYSMSTTNHSAPHYVVYSIPLSSRPSHVQIFSSATYSQTPSAYVPPSM